MKRYLVFLFSALFGFAQIGHAAKPDNGKQGKHKAPQSAHNGQPSGHMAQQSGHKAQRHASQPRSAFKKSSNVSAGFSASHQASPKFQKNHRTGTTRDSTNVHAQKQVNHYNAAQGAQLTKRNQNNSYNAAQAAQLTKRNHNNTYNAAQAAQLTERNQNNANIATQRNWQNQNNAAFAGQTRSGDWQSSSLSYSDAYSRRQSGYHDQNWWTSRYGTNIVLFGGGYYYWDTGYWYPAYGYNRAYSTYQYDGPIYGYNNLPPGEVVTNVQSALQQQSYYRGEIDGSIGPVTRSALRRYQRDNGLRITAAIDRPTLASLGII